MATPSSQARVLVTGLSGFTGQYVAAALEASGFAVLGRPPADISYDLRDPASLQRLIELTQPDYVVHLAAVSFVAHGSATDMYAVNAVGTDNLLRALASSAPSVAKVLVASSANVYGNATDLPITELTPTAPVNHYACSKLAMEYLARTWMDKLPLVIVRPFNYTGVGQDENFLVPKLVGHFVRRLPVVELGNIDVERDFSDVRSVAEAYVRLLAQAPAGETFNLCSGQSTSLRWILEHLTALTGHSIEVSVNPGLVRSNEIQRMVGSRAHAEERVGALEWIDFHSTLAWMCREWPANPSG